MMTYPTLWLRGLPFELEWDLLPIVLLNLRIVSSGVKLSSRWLPIWESATRRPQTLCGKAFDETRAEDRLVIQDLAIPQASQELFDPIKACRAHICTISGAFHGTCNN
ncbi:hypothetical protein Tco_0956151 [Tanacetum coccineum]|uniref:Uncharacterized protein n=1 Tax=Tanacetum coccineum TaxID=301880 RepID=A0ABQ5E993_9ASTR